VNVHNKLECLSLASLSNLAYCLRLGLETTELNNFQALHSKMDAWPNPQTVD